MAIASAGALPGHHQHGEIPGDDARRRQSAHGACSREIRRRWGSSCLEPYLPAGKIAVAGHGLGDIHSSGDGDRLTVVERLKTANRSAFASIRSARRCRRLPRAEALILRQGPDSKAARAARTAVSTSAASASATWQISSPVEGLMVANVLPDWLGCQRLLINSFNSGRTISVWFGTIAAGGIECGSFNKAWRGADHAIFA